MIDIDDTETTDENRNGGSGKDRLRSTIAFPYSSLVEAETIASALLRSWGGSASQDQLAGGLGTNPRSGTFRTKLGATRIFGVVEVTRGKVTLTDLGHRLADPESSDAAKVEAFMTVPLFSAIYDEYEGRSLPPDKGLEQKIADLGVSAKQTAKARQALQASAKRAGFFDTTPGRLIRPGLAKDSGKSSAPKQKEEVAPVSQSNSASIPLPDLWLTLLDKGDSWSAEKTQDFVNAARKLREVMARDS
jgi:hypothetical protein